MNVREHLGAEEFYAYLSNMIFREIEFVAKKEQILGLNTNWQLASYISFTKGEFIDKVIAIVLFKAGSHC